MANSSMLNDNGKMQLELETGGDSITFRPSGVLDEDVNFSIILETINRMAAIIKSVSFDLGHVKRMNSCGVREWIMLMERMPTTLPLSFVNVNELFVEQANMLPGMFGRKGAKVASFHVPYHCPNCNIDTSVLVEPKTVPRVDGHPRAPECNCTQCGEKLDFDWIEEEYFDFLNLI